MVPEQQAKKALAMALVADLVQLVVFPYFGWGAIVPLNAAVDVALCLMLTRLVGWHIAFIPCFIMELTPVVTLVPSWTLAVLIANRRLQAAPPASSQTAPVEPLGKVIDV
jgi:hypothetical protein